VHGFYDAKPVGTLSGLCEKSKAVDGSGLSARARCPCYGNVHGTLSQNTLVRLFDSPTSMTFFKQTTR